MTQHTTRSIAALRGAAPALFACSAAMLIAPLVHADIPPRPEEIVFDELVFEAPAAGDYQYDLGNGVQVFLAPSHEFPLINLTLMKQMLVGWKLADAIVSFGSLDVNMGEVDR